MRIGRADGRWSAWMVLSSLATVAYAVLPNDSIAAAVVQFVVGLAAFVMAIAGIRRHRPVDAAGWYIFAVGQLLWVAGDVVFQFDAHILHIDVYPSFADVLYLAGYPLFFVGVLRLGRSRFRRDRAGLLDAFILATGVGLVLWVFAIEPLVVANGTAWIALPFILGIPVSDVLLFAVAVSLLTTAGRRTVSLNLMTAGLALLIVTDTVYSYLTTTGTYDGGLVDCGWLFAYVLWTGAMLHPSVARSAPAAAGGPPRVSRGRLALVAAGTLLVPAVLLIQGVRHDLESTWLAVAVVAVVLFGLVLTRMSGFVTQVQSQSQQLEDLAMRDELTGLANRRQFEQRIALVAGGPAQVLVLDLTGFKQVNDRFGHAAGDQLLAGVAARLTAKIRGRDLVARMGGDEFAVLVPDATAAEGDAVAERLVAVFGGGQAVLAVTALHQLGIRIALDDFGTGHSSLGLLQTVPVDILKVDKSFVDNITMAGRHAVIATALIQVADGLGLTAVAEGVETAEQAAELHRIGYRLAQGYHFGRPIAEPDFRSPQALVV